MKTTTDSCVPSVASEQSSSGADDTDYYRSN